MENINTQIKMFRPVELSYEQRRLLNRISAKAIGIIAIIDLVLLVLCIKDGMDTLPFLLAAIVFFDGLVLLFELRDKIKLRKYDKIYIIKAYIKNSSYIRHGRRVSLIYYDFIQDLILPVDKNIEYCDAPNQELVSGTYLYILVGSKDSRLNYISPSPANLK